MFGAGPSDELIVCALGSLQDSAGILGAGPSKAGWQVPVDSIARQGSPEGQLACAAHVH